MPTAPPGPVSCVLVTATALGERCRHLTKDVQGDDVSPSTFKEMTRHGMRMKIRHVTRYDVLNEDTSPSVLGVDG